MAAGPSKSELRNAVRSSLRGLAKELKQAGIRTAELEGQTLRTRFGTYGYRIIRASNGEVAGLLQLDGRDL